MLVMLNKIHEAKSTMTGGILRSIIGPRQSHQYVHNLLMAWRPLPPNKGYFWSSKTCICDQIAMILAKKSRLCFSSSWDYFMHREITEETEVFCDE